MVRHTLRLDTGALNNEGIRVARRAVTKVVRGTFNRSQVLVPVDNGVLRLSGHEEPVQTRGMVVVGGVIYTAEYAAAVHNGRRALTIKAKTRADGRQGYLKFNVGGRTVYARSVRQKARRGRPYLAAALREVATAEGFTVSIP